MEKTRYHILMAIKQNKSNYCCHIEADWDHAAAWLQLGFIITFHIGIHKILRKMFHPTKFTCPNQTINKIHFDFRGHFFTHSLTHSRFC